MVKVEELNSINKEPKKPQKLSSNGLEIITGGFIEGIDETLEK